MLAIEVEEKPIIQIDRKRAEYLAEACRYPVLNDGGQAYLACGRAVIGFAPFEGYVWISDLFWKPGHIWDAKRLVGFVKDFANSRSMLCRAFVKADDPKWLRVVMRLFRPVSLLVEG